MAGDCRGVNPDFSLDQRRTVLPLQEPGLFRAGRRGPAQAGHSRAMTAARKLAAILAADVVGFSRLAGADEDRTLARLRALRSDLHRPDDRPPQRPRGQAHR